MSYKAIWMECPECHKPFSSNGSYRVHKHRFHRQNQVLPAVPLPAMQIVQQEPKPPEPQEEFLNIESSPEPESIKENETEHEETRGGGNLGGGAAVGIGLLIAIGIAWWLKNRK